MHFACILCVKMPKAIQIRDVPDDVHAVMRARAAAAGMSMSEYLRSELIKLASRPTTDEWLARVATQPPAEISTQQIVDIIREMRGPLPPDD
jgi:plasmid stability protein